LVELVQKLSNSNVINMIITADHGFLFSRRAIEDSDFVAKDVDGSRLVKKDRRFAVGKGLFDSSSYRIFKAGDLGIEGGDLEVAIPNSVKRFRQQGTGTRFVHGGASLQELVIPIITINMNKGRQSDVKQTAVSIIPDGKKVISVKSIIVELEQAEAVTDKCHARTLMAGVYSQTGELISDQVKTVFDAQEANFKERRRRQVKLTLGAEANRYNGQDIVVRFSELVDNTTQLRKYGETTYRLNLTFASDEFTDFDV
jgi:hypothetical protein